MAQIKARKDGAWVAVPSGTTIKAEKDGSLVNPTKIQARKDGAWVTVWNKSDPVKYTFVANRSKSFRHNDGSWSTSPTAVAVRNGVFSGETL